MPIDLTDTPPLVQGESVNVYHMLNLWCGNSYYRICSMMWHSHSWPGGLAFTTADIEGDTGQLLGHNEAYDAAVKCLRNDLRIFLDVSATPHPPNVRTNPKCLGDEPLLPPAFVMKLLKSSPLHTRFVYEVALMFTIPLSCVSNFARRHLVNKLLKLVFSSWGQTKVVEDVFKTLRQREHQDTLNGFRTVPAYYAAMVAMGAIGIHQRTEMKPDSGGPKGKGTAKKLFASKGHVCSLLDAHKITEKTSWPTFSPQTAKKVPADLILLRLLKLGQCWMIASRCWGCMFFRRGSVILEEEKVGRETTKRYFVVLGNMGRQMLLVWEVEPMKTTKRDKLAFLLGGGTIVHKEPTCFAIINLGDYQTVPCAPVSPLGFYIVNGRKYGPGTGVVLLQGGKACPVLLDAARNAFFDIHLPDLKTLAAEHGVALPGLTLPVVVTTLVRHLLTTLGGEAPADADVRGILALRCADDVSVFDGVVDEDLLMEVLDKEQLDALQEPNRTLGACVCARVSVRVCVCVCVSVWVGCAHVSGSM